MDQCWGSQVDTWQFLSRAPVELIRRGVQHLAIGKLQEDVLALPEIGDHELAWSAPGMKCGVQWGRQRHAHPFAGVALQDGLAKLAGIGQQVDHLFPLLSLTRPLALASSFLRRTLALIYSSNDIFDKPRSSVVCTYPSDNEINAPSAIGSIN